MQNKWMRTLLWASVAAWVGCVVGCGDEKGHDPSQQTQAQQETAQTATQVRVGMQMASTTSDPQCVLGRVYDADAGDSAEPIYVDYTSYTWWGIDFAVEAPAGRYLLEIEGFEQTCEELAPDFSVKPAISGRGFFEVIPGRHVAVSIFMRPYSSESEQGPIPSGVFLESIDASPDLIAINEIMTLTAEIVDIRPDKDDLKLTYDWTSNCSNSLFQEVSGVPNAIQFTSSTAGECIIFLEITSDAGVTDTPVLVSEDLTVYVLSSANSGLVGLSVETSQAIATEDMMVGVYRDFELSPGEGNFYDALCMVSNYNSDYVNQECSTLFDARTPLNTRFSLTHISADAFVSSLDGDAASAKIVLDCVVDDQEERDVQSASASFIERRLDSDYDDILVGETDLLYVPAGSGRCTLLGTYTDDLSTQVSIGLQFEFAEPEIVVEGL